MSITARQTACQMSYTCGVCGTDDVDCRTQKCPRDAANVRGPAEHRFEGAFDMVTIPPPSPNVNPGGP